MLAVLILTRIIGPLNPDEVLFSHILWLTLEGKRQYFDFYSYHFPTYFFLYDLVLPHVNGDSLGFIWAVRLSNLAVVAGYAGLLFATERRMALYLLPLLFFALWISRMIEVRPDTLGLLAFNAAWALLLVGKSRRSFVLATMLAIFAAACSARGVVMGIGFGAALGWRAIVHREWRFILIPAAVLVAALAAAVAAYLAEPGYVELMLRSALLDPGAVLPWLSVSQRILAFDRFPQVSLALLAMLFGTACVIKGVNRDKSGVIGLAALAQLMLIFFDPSPFPYVYGWALIPCLAGLALADELFQIDARKWVSGLAVAGGGSLAAVTIAYPLIVGSAPPAGSNYRVLPDPPLDAEAVRGLPLKRLMALELRREHQQSLANQLMVREEICRRINGSVMSFWQSHPICLQDATYYGFSIKWPNIGLKGPPTREQWFEEVFKRNPPSLVIWTIPGAVVTLSPWAESLLNGYDIENGFAIRADPIGARKDNSGRAASPPNSDHS
jgi:hypothetical protein